ncbi:MAG: hypothetical protein KTR30_20680 [Saprospiraceae bacterium]|nr:hypothetical protein [Saprospiraceae bacterium]
MKRYILLFGLLLFGLGLIAQPKQIIHQSFSVDEMNNVQLDLNSEYEIEMWPGSEILVETKIQLTNATNSIMRYLIDNKRYAIGLDTVGERSVTLLSIDKEKREIETSKGKLEEEIIVRIFMPDFFEKKQEQLWVRSKPLVTKNGGDESEDKEEGEKGGEEKPIKKEQKE